MCQLRSKLKSPSCSLNCSVKGRNSAWHGRQQPAVRRMHNASSKTLLLRSKRITLFVSQHSKFVQTGLSTQGHTTCIRRGSRINAASPRRTRLLNCDLLAFPFGQQPNGGDEDAKLRRKKKEEV